MGMRNILPIHSSWFLHLVPSTLVSSKGVKMAASPHGHSGSLRLARLVRWAAPKLFKPSQSPLVTVSLSLPR